MAYLIDLSHIEKITNNMIMSYCYLKHNKAYQNTKKDRLLKLNNFWLLIRPQTNSEQNNSVETEVSLFERDRHFAEFQMHLEVFCSS